MAWNANKTDLLKQLLKERMASSNQRDLAIKYGITKSALQVIGSHIDDTAKQNILNELIVDKVAMLTIDKAEEQGKIDALTGIQADLNSNKE